VGEGQKKDLRKLDALCALTCAFLHWLKEWRKHISHQATSSQRVVGHFFHPPLNLQLSSQPAVPLNRLPTATQV